MWNPFGWLMVFAILIMANVVRDAKANVHGYLLIAFGIGTLAMLAVWREIVRATSLKALGYVVSDYRVNVDWPSLLLFSLPSSASAAWSGATISPCSIDRGRSQANTRRTVLSPDWEQGPWLFSHFGSRFSLPTAPLSTSATR